MLMAKGISEKKATRMRILNYTCRHLIATIILCVTYTVMYQLIGFESTILVGISVIIAKQYSDKK